MVFEQLCEMGLFPIKTPSLCTFVTLHHYPHSLSKEEGLGHVSEAELFLHREGVGTLLQFQFILLFPRQCGILLEAQLLHVLNGQVLWKGKKKGDPHHSYL